MIINIGSLLQKHMKPHCVHYILHRRVSCGTLCSTALSICVVSARGSEVTDYYRRIGQTLLDPPAKQGVYLLKLTGRCPNRYTGIIRGSS